MESRLDWRGESRFLLLWDFPSSLISCFSLLSLLFFVFFLPLTSLVTSKSLYLVLKNVTFSFLIYFIWLKKISQQCLFIVLNREKLSKGHVHLDICSLYMCNKHTGLPWYTVTYIDTHSVALSLIVTIIHKTRAGCTNGNMWKYSTGTI